MWSRRLIAPGAITVGLMMCAGSALAQDPDARDHAGASRVVSHDQVGRPRLFDRDTASIESRGGALLGHGPDYRVLFEADRVVFTPALGKDAPRNLPLTFALERAGRASEIDRVRAVQPGTRTHDATTARYLHPGYEEVYEVRPEGLEQSFVFGQLPVGSGDLIVRGRVITDLPLQRAQLDGLVFEERGVGGVRLGTVVGIDATGSRIEGEMTFDAGRLEMRLPESFVDKAVLPLTLDPLLSSVLVSTASDDEAPDVALDPGDERYLVVWTRFFSGSDSDIRARFVDRSGTPVGGTLYLRNTVGRLSFDAHVAFIEDSSNFIVVWNEGLDVWAIGVHSSTRALTNALQVTTGSQIEAMVDVGGEATTADNDAIVVWANLSRGDIEAAQIGVNSGVLSIAGTATIGFGLAGQWGDVTPAISKTGGASGRHLVVWNRDFFAPSLLESEIHGIVISRDLIPVGPLINFSASVADDDDPDVDGDGTNWVVAWESEDDANSGDNDIYCRSVSYDATTRSVRISPLNLIEGDPNDDEINPTVAWMDGSCLVGYADETLAAGYSGYVKSVDPFTCGTCEGESYLSTEPANAQNISIAGGGFANGRFEALIVAELEDLATGKGDIAGYTFRAEDGRTSQTSGGSCTGAGVPYATCAVVGNPSFMIRARGAQPSSRAVLVLSAMPAVFSMGSCRIVADPFSGVLVSSGTNAFGDAEKTLPIPAAASLVGASFWAQWWVATPGGCGGFCTSDALYVGIE